MNVNQFKEVIRKLVAEEVQKQLPKLLFEMLGSNNNNSQKPIIRESIPTPSNNNVVKKQTVVTPQRVQQQPTQPKPQRRYASNPVLNQILNEITPGLPQNTTGESVLDGIVAPVFDKIGSNESLNVVDNNTTSMKQLMSEGIINDMVSTEEVSSQNVVEPITPVPISTDLKAKLFNKDFSAILKKSKNPGMTINSGRVGMM